MPSADPALEELRRRVYAPGATDADRAEYQRVLDGVSRRVAPRPASPVSAPGPGEAAPAPSRAAWRRAPLLLVAATALVVVAALAIPAGLTPPARSEPVPAPTRLDVRAPQRSRLLENLDAPRWAGIGAYIRNHRAETPFRGSTYYLPFEHWGTGSRTIALKLPNDVPTVGRATVVLVVREPARVGWTLTALRPYLRADDPSNVLDRRRGEAETGRPLFATVPYGSATVPTTLRIEVPPGVRWGAAVVLSD